MSAPAGLSRPTTAVPGPGETAARNAVALVFAVNGFLFASWVARLPAVRSDLGVTPGRLGLVLLALSVGAVVALPFAGWLTHRLGARRTVRAGAVLAALAFVVAGAAVAVQSLPLLVVALFAYGFGVGGWDVAMNVEAAVVEQALRRPIMPRFHAGFSLGSVAGAAVGAGAAALALPVAVHFTIIGAAAAVAVVLGVRHFLPAGALVREAGAGVTGERGSVLRAWREPRTLAIGLFVLGMAFVEGTANDWLALAMVDGYRVEPYVGALAFGLLVASMTATRLAGPALLERWGRVAVLRGGALLVILGVLLVVGGGRLVPVIGTAAALAVATVGVVAWGAGGALGFPVGMSAASDDPVRSAVRVGVVSTVGYTAFLAGPPLLGLLGDVVGVANALLGALVAVVLSLLTVGALKPPAPQR